ncbi:MAG: oligosaccharide flippase family protein [Bacteroidia bacterium]|nr:oligosaccharide flippase family protein [Bacteroidia bacterium]
MSKIKGLAGETVLYGLGTILPRMINFFLILPQTAAFAPEEFGIITDLYAWVAFLNVVYTFGMETAYFRFASKPGADSNQVFRTAQTAVLTISLLLSTLAILFSAPIAAAFDIAGKGNYIIWLALIMAIDASVAIPFARLRLQKQALKFSVAKIINVLIVVVFNVYFLEYAYNPAVGVAYVFLINLIANAFYLVYFAKTLLSWRPAFRRDVFWSMFNYAYPIMITGLAGMTNEMFSRVTLRWWLPENFYGEGKSAQYALGVFGACYRYAVFMNLAVQAFRFAAEPFFFSNAHDKKSPELFARVNHYFIVACCFFWLAISTNVDVLKYLLRDEAYWEGLGIVPVLLLGYLFLGVYYNLTVWFKLTDRTYYGTIIALIGAVVTIVLNYFLIPIAGYTGSSWATLACYALMTVLCYLIGQRYFPIPYHVLTDMLYIALTGVVIYTVGLVAIDSQWMATLVHLGVLAVCGVVIFFVERKGLRRALA